MSKTKIETLLRTAFAPTYLLVMDDSAKHAGHVGAKEGGHYNVEIQSSAFNNIKTIEAHRMVYAAVAPIKHSIHALGIKIIKNS